MKDDYFILELFLNLVKSLISIANFGRRVVTDVIVIKQWMNESFVLFIDTLYITLYQPYHCKS